MQIIIARSCMKEPVKIGDVAKLAGVSSSSVSRALNPDRYASEELRARVAEAVAKLGYEPNAFAQSLRVQSSRTIGCMVSDVANPLYAEIIGAAEARLQEAGYLMVVANSQSGSRELDLLNMFRRRRMDGLLVTLDDDTREDVLAVLKDSGVPLVLLDRDINLSCDRVGVDHRQGAYAVVSYLLSLGHRSILLETPSHRVRPGRERIAGAEAAVRDAGLPPSVLKVSDHVDLSQPHVFSDVLQELARPSRPTAIVTLGTAMLAGTLSAIEANRLRIPEDISVVSIGDTTLAQFAAPGITALRWDLKQLGRTAAELLIERIEGRAGTYRTVTFPTELVLRRSCVPPAELQMGAK
ncbi:LacI family DNA-binding transcriptional regulator [Noviherbaspirillum saxi]|nr:substrate-binding domain-containing protein [Noviherbaspirillum saxi]